jgi:hypothetical protein
MVAESARVEIDLAVEFAPLPDEKVSAWRASLLLLMQEMECIKNVDNILGDDGGFLRGLPALFSVEDGIEVVGRE